MNQLIDDDGQIDLAMRATPAPADREHNRVFGKLVGVIDPADAAVSIQR